MPKLSTMAFVLSFSCLAVPALAETAHNAQAGADGGTSNNCAATAYYAEGTGCLSSEVGGLLNHGDAALPRGAAIRRSRSLPPPNSDD